MESSYVFRILQAKALLAALILASFATSLPARAVQVVPSQTFKSGTKIACTLDERLDSSALSYGDTFKLRVVDTSHPALNGSEITGYITDVKKPSGAEQGRVGFFLTSIKLPNGTKKPITAYVVNRRVTQYNPSAQYQQRQRLSPAAGRPYGSVTPGPIAWQMNMGSGPSTVGQQHHSQSLGGYVYASASQWPIIVPPGTPVTVELAADLTIP
jgi:hypothetical protein